MSKANLTISVNVKSAAEGRKMARCIQTIVNQLTVESLEILAKKSKKPGINMLIKNYQNIL
ncbi:hypothetical protein [Persicobacter diffluens]|uniref:Uncharacterized protein n=1 Tax=Persicobacter diffluens TaxID=981 RepID=A0AAN5AQL0_9BACT|nr:hypothetical protein PEDI_55150 [Persicobacter diffluens]